MNDAWRLVPHAEVLYACDARWWNHHGGVPQFAGEKWSSIGDQKGDSNTEGKQELADRYGLNLIVGRPDGGYSTDPTHIHYGDNSGHQAVNLAILMGATRILLIGFDMRGDSHFFGRHPDGLARNNNYEVFAKKFREPPPGVEIINCTKGSAIKTYPFADLAECLRSAA